MTKHAYPTPPRSDERRVLGHPVPRIEDPPLVTGRGLFAGRRLISASAPYAHGALEPCPCAYCFDRYGGGASLAGSSRGVDRRRYRRHSADRFSRSDVGCAQALSAAGAGARPRPLCRRSDRGRVRGKSLHRRGRRRPRRCRSRGTAHRHQCRRSDRRVRYRTTRPNRRSSTTASATSTPRSRTRTPSSNWTCASAAIPACPWRRAAPSAATTHRAISSNCTAPRRCRIATRIR